MGAVNPAERAGTPRKAALPTTHSILDAGAIGVEIARHFGLGASVHCELLVRGMNDVYLVERGRERFAARVWRANWRSDSDVAYELGFIEHLAAQGLPVVTSRAADDGSRFLSVEAPEGPRQVALFNWVQGCAVGEAPTPIACRRIGALMGLVHKAGATYKPDARRFIDRGGQIRADFPVLAKRLAGRPDDLEVYRGLAESIPRELIAVDTAICRFGPIHGDIHLFNAFIDADSNIILLDFDTCGEAHYLQDLASFIWSNEYGGRDRRLTDAFLDGYQIERSMSSEEVAMVPLFISAKEFRYLCGYATNVNIVGHGPLRNPDLDWFARSIKRHAFEAGLL